MPPEEFSGGEAPGQANYVLRELGFTVERKGGESDMSESETVAEARSAIVEFTLAIGVPLAR